MTDANQPSQGGPNKFLPTLGMELVNAKPKLPTLRPGSQPAPPPQTKTHAPNVNLHSVPVAGSAPWMGIDDYLAYCETTDASDLHLAPGHPPLVRIDGELLRIPDRSTLTGDDTLAISDGLLNAGQRACLADTGAADGAISSARGVRYRYNVFRRQGKRAIVLRRLEDRFRTLAELGLPVELYKLADLPDGLVVFSGPTGCGKSTTLATLLDKINRERRCHIVTIEDPVEYLHEPKLSEVNQKGTLHRRAGF